MVSNRLSKMPISAMQPEHFRRSPGVNERGEIEGLIGGVKSDWKHGPPSARMASLAADAMRYFESTGVRITESLAGRPLIDLGAGNPWVMMIFAARCGASTYIAVDRYHDYSGLMMPGASLVNEDMLRFLTHQPDGFANISMNAIDEVVLMDDRGSVHSAYASRLMAEAARVVPSGGIAFGIGTPFLRILGSAEFEQLELSPNSMVTEALAIYRKY